MSNTVCCNWWLGFICLLGQEYNFLEESNETSTTQGFPYDYMSVMHYGKDAFSNGNGSTIITKDPKFQDVIGQRLEMSPSDVQELNHLYKCSKCFEFKGAKHSLFQWLQSVYQCEHKALNPVFFIHLYRLNQCIYDALRLLQWDHVSHDSLFTEWQWLANRNTCQWGSTVWPHQSTQWQQ